MKPFLLVTLLLLSACAPQTATVGDVPAQFVRSAPDLSALRESMLRVPQPGDAASFAVTEGFLNGSPLQFEGGTAQLLPELVLNVQQVGQAYVVLPVQLQLESGSGLYLMLLESRGEVFAQRPSLNLGETSLSSLSFEMGQVVVNGSSRYRIEAGRLVEVQSQVQ